MERYLLGSRSSMDLGQDRAQDMMSAKRYIELTGTAMDEGWMARAQILATLAVAAATLELAEKNSYEEYLREASED